jgi:hypothetical protein
VCLVLVIEVAVGQALQFAAEHEISHADANAQVSPMDHGLYASGTCRSAGPVRAPQFDHRRISRFSGPAVSNVVGAATRWKLMVIRVRLCAVQVQQT